MPLIDLQSLPSGSELHSDLLIVGGGIAGLVLADALRGSARHVDLLEAGGVHEDSKHQELYSADLAGIQHLGITEGRFRVYGGSSTRWGGQLLPLAGHDFDVRPHVPESGWPLNPSELTSYLKRCEDLLAVNHAPFDGSLIEYLPTPGPHPSSPDLQSRFSKWAPFSRRNVATTLGSRCESDPNTRVFLHAGVTQLELEVGGCRVQSLKVSNFCGGQFTFTAREVVLAAGTIETTRLLLASGIGNCNDQVGRWFHDHLSIKAATLYPECRRSFLERYAPWFIGSTRHTIKLESTAGWQDREACLNVMGHLVFETPPNSSFAWLRQQLQARQLQRNSTRAVLTHCIENLPSESLDLLYLAWKSVVRRRRWCPSRAAITLCIDSEQQPNPDSRIILSPQRDSLGMPKVVVDWRWGESERHAFASYRNLFDHHWQTWNLGHIDWHYSFERDTGWQDDVRDTYHMMGGTRMSINPQQGVVDPQLRVHGVPNLFVASCSVFPTGGSSNPTLTLMQLTLRLAEQLRHY